MHCPECGHNNITAFDFCEECLAALPNSSWAQRTASRDPFDFAEERTTEKRNDDVRDVSPFPWNPPGHDVGELVGRGRELEEATQLVRSSITDWSGRLVLLTGDRGVGTSTFVQRFAEDARKLERGLLVAQARCLPGAAQPYAVVGRLLRDALGIPADADSWEAGKALLEEAGELAGEGEEQRAREIAELVAFLVGFKIERSRYLNATGAQAQTLIPRASQALTRLLRSLAFDRPTVLVIEDAHRAPAPLLALLDLVASGLARVPVVILVVGRPSLRKAQPGWEELTRVHLGPMGRTETEALLRRMLQGVDPIPSDFIERVVHRSGGNAYALRAIVRYLHEVGALQPTDNGDRWIVEESVFFDLDIPDSLRGVANARLATLTQDEVGLLQEASVIGRQFHFGCLVMLQRRTADQSVWTADGVGKDTEIVDLRRRVEALVQREILRRMPDQSLAGEDVYAFRAELDAELLYEQTPAPTRQAIHRRVAHWIELQPPHFVEHNLARIALHHQLGGDRVRAATFYKQAGRRARGSFHNNEAIQFYEDALRLLADDDAPRRITCLRALGELYVTVGRNELALGAYRQLLRHAWMMRSRSRGAHALNRLGRIHRSMGNYDAARDHLVTAMQLCRAVQDSSGIAEVLEDLGQLAWLTGDTERALLTFERSKKLCIELEDAAGLARTLHYIGCVYLDTAEVDRAEPPLRDALKIRRKLNRPDEVSMTLNNLGVLAWGRGDADKAIEAWRESLAISQEIGNRPVASMLMANLAEAYLHSGRPDEAQPLIEEARDIARAAGDRRTLVSVLIDAANLAAARGEHTAALMEIDAALAEAKALGNLRLIGVASVARGEISSTMSADVGDTRGVEEGLEAMRTGIETLREAGTDIERGAALEQYADALAQLGRDDDAAEARARAEAVFGQRNVRPPRRTESRSDVPVVELVADIAPVEGSVSPAAEEDPAPDAEAPKSNESVASAEPPSDVAALAEDTLQGPVPIGTATPEDAKKASATPKKGAKKKSKKKKKRKKQPPTAPN